MTTPRPSDATEIRDDAAAPTLAAGAAQVAEDRGPGGPAIGSMVDRYRVLGLLGEGGMGSVYRALDTRLGREVALKLRVAREVEASACSVLCGLLVREARILGGLSHPNVITVHDVGPYGDCIFLAMALVEGETLRAWARGRNSAEIRRALADAGRGLQAAHQHGVVHRDFKPENVLVSTEGQVRVVDFGVARTDRDLEAEGGMDCGCASSGRAVLRELGGPAGTPLYMSPEQHAGGLTDARSDQYAFALTAWELLTGSYPFPTGAFGIRWKAMVDRALPAPVPGVIEPELESALRTALSFDASARHPDLEPLLQALG